MIKRIGFFGATMLMAHYFLFFWHTLVFANNNTYTQKEDSLMTLLEISPDRVKSKIYIELSDLAINKDTSIAKVFARKALDYANMFGAHFDLANSHYRMGRILFHQDSLESALFHIKKSLAISHEIEGQGEIEQAYLILSGKSLYLKASIYQGLYSDSAKIILPDLLQALERIGGSDEYKILAEINHLLGQQYFEINMYDQGLEYFNKALEYYTVLNDKHAMAAIYMQMSYRVDRATGHEYAQRAIDLFAESGDSLGMARNLIHIAYNTRKILDPETNLGYLQLGYDIYEKYNNYPGMVYALFHLATYHSYHLGDSAAALKYLKKGAEISLEHHVVKSAGHIFITLGGFYKNRCQYDSAAYYLHIADSITALIPGKPERIRYFIGMGDLQVSIGRYQEAEDYLTKALQQAEKIDDWQLVSIAFHTLYTALKNSGNFKNDEKK